MPPRRKEKLCGRRDERALIIRSVYAEAPREHCKDYLARHSSRTA